jgi:hypothetical protein
MWYAKATTGISNQTTNQKPLIRPSSIERSKNCK